MFVTLSTIIRLVTTAKSGGFLRLFNASCEGIAGFFFRRSTIASLSEFDDRALRDIGLERSEIEAEVHRFVALRSQMRR
jgi:uncharacterized protein YjiS (DUF1127 family)